MLRRCFEQRTVLPLAVLVCATAISSEAQSADPPAPQTQLWQVGLEITGGDGTATGLVATAPVPDTWPEQQVKLIKQDKTPNVRRVSFRKLSAGARQMTISIPRLSAGETAKVIMTYEVIRTFAGVPPETENLRFAPRSSSLRAFLQPSPLIESSDDSIQDLARQITTGQTSAWGQTQAIFDWVRENVTYREGSLKGALAALRDGTGDCEEFASLFIALCRASGIPARTVWVPDHCYCEFYLRDASGKGMWIQCDATRDYPFGSVYDPRMILQKGDNFYVAAHRKWMRYPIPTLQAANVSGQMGPSIKYIRQPVD